MSDDNWFESRARRNWIRVFWAGVIVALLCHILVGVALVMETTR